MRVLVLTQVVPGPGDAGPRIKTYFALRTLAERHDIELITYVRDDAEAEAARRCEAYCSRVTPVRLARKKALEPYYAFRGWSSLTPFLVQRDARHSMRRAIRDRLRSAHFDVIHADQLSMALYLDLAPRGTRTVFDAHNAVHELVRDVAGRQPTPLHRAAAEVEWRLLRRFEGATARRSDLTLAVSARDQQALAAAAGRSIRSAVVPIGIEARERVPFPVRTDARSILSVATMHYPPNAEAIRWFRDAVWPLLRTDESSSVVDIAGPRPPADIEAWGAADERVRVHGYVHDLDGLYRNAALFVVPLRAGSGVRVKVLEALALGIPVVTTSIGIDGLKLEHGRHVLVADEPDAFAAAIRELLDSSALRERLSSLGRRVVVERYDWRTCCQPLLDAYERLERAPASALAVSQV